MLVWKKVLIVSTIFCTFLTAPRSAALAAPTADELAFVNVINRVRAAHGAPALRVDPRLERAARAHSRDMLRRGYFAHGSFAQRLAGFGARGPALGENLGWGVGPHANAEAIVGKWLASPPHRANLLRRGFRRVGVGRVVGVFAGYAGAAVVTADFAGR
jgi:uncharacterized protein YkwD